VIPITVFVCYPSGEKDKPKRDAEVLYFNEQHQALHGGATQEGRVAGSYARCRARQPRTMAEGAARHVLGMQECR
jgi:hypothetical protein